MKSLLLTLAGIAGSFTLSVGALADTVVYDGGTGNLVPALWYGNTPHGSAFVADAAATLAAVGSITFDGIDWVGGYVGLHSNPSGPPSGPHVNPDAADNFMLNIYQDNAGVPGTLVTSLALGAANRAATGSTLGGVSEYGYSASFSAVSLTAGEYFFALSDGYSGTGYWGWETTSNGPLLGGASLAGNWVASPTENLAFHLTSSTAVPIPAAAWLFLSGLGGLVALARKKPAA